MLDFSQQLKDKIDTILEHWIKAVRQNRQIENGMRLSDTALGNAVPDLLAAMITVLSRSSEDDDFATIAEASLEHGLCRAKQGFNAAEIAREYRLLRREIFSALESELVKGTSREVIRAFRIVDNVIDQAVSWCFDSYVEQRLQEVEQLQTQLTLTNQELMRLLQASQDNLSQLAHELRTPLTSIIGYSELLLRQQQRNAELGPSPSIDNIERVLRNGRQLLRLVNDSLELARCEAGKIKLHLISIDVRSVINDAIAMIEPLAQAKGLQLKVKSDRAPARVLTDPFRLQQILTNLLGNAVQFTDSGSVTVECVALSNEKWSLSVRDTGIGIALDDQARIFEPLSLIHI